MAEIVLPYHVQSQGSPYFNGSEELVRQPEIGGAPINAAPLTMNVWVKPFILTNFANIFAIGNRSSQNHAFRLAHGNAGNGRFQVRGTGATNVDSIGFEENRWYMLTGVMDRDNVCHVYVNASNKVSVQATSIPVPDNVESLVIGARNDGAANYFGWIAEPAVWNVALNDAQVAALYRNAAAVPAFAVAPEGLIYYDPLGRVGRQLPSSIVLPENRYRENGNIRHRFGPPRVRAVVGRHKKIASWPSEEPAPLTAQTVSIPRQHRQPSLQQGFARHTGESDRPELWEGLIAALSPSLAARRWVEIVRGQTLTGTIPDDGFTPTEGIVAANHQGSAGATFPLRADVSTGISIVARLKTNDFTGNGIVEWGDTSAVNRGTLMFFDANDFQWRVMAGGSVPGNAVLKTPAAGLTGIHTWVGTYDEANGSAIWLDGRRVATLPALAGLLDNTPYQNISVMSIGGNFWPYTGAIFDLLVYDRELRPAEIKQLSIDPLAPFRLRPQRFALPSAGPQPPPDVAGQAIGTIDTAGDADVVPQLGGLAVGTIDTAGEADVVPLVPDVTGLAIGTIDTAGAADVVPQLGGLAVGTIDTAGDADTVAPIDVLADPAIGQIDTTGDADTVAPIQVLADPAIGQIDTAGDADLVVFLTGLAVGQIDTAGSIDVGTFIPIGKRICALPPHKRHSTLGD